MFLLALFACDPTSNEACQKAAEEPQALTIGTGETTFTDLSDGDTVGLVYGAQGGIHVWGSLRVSGIVQGASDSLADKNNPLVSYVLKDGDTEVAGFHDLPHHFTVKLDGTWEFLADRLIFFENDLSGYDGVPLTMHASLVDACGTELSADTDVLLDLGS